MGLGTAILSNGSPEMLEVGVSNSNLGKVLDWIISVDTIKIFKPSPKVYQMAIDQLGCNKEEILFFSSNAWDVSGAATFGFQTVWVTDSRKPPKGFQEFLFWKLILLMLFWNNFQMKDCFKFPNF